MNGWILDVRASVRALRQAPQLALVAIAAIALSIGVASTMFSVLDGIVLRPLPFPHPERLVAIWERDPAQPDTWLAGSELSVGAWLARSRSFELAVAGRNVSYTLTSFEDGDTPLMRLVSHGYFELLGIAPQLGRTFTAEEDRRGAPPVVLLSHELWQRRFGGDPQVVGRTTGIDGRATTIVGVMPPATDNPVFGTGNAPHAWLPLALPESGLDRRQNGHVTLARLREGVGIDAARHELAAISAQLRREHPEHEREALVVPAAERLVREARPAALLLFGSGLFVLLVACGNVANLQLTRALERRREIALRQALGASRRHLLRQLLTEGVLLASIGAFAGLLLAYWAIAALPLLLPDGGFRFDLDAGVLAFTLAVALLSGIGFGLVPALHALRPDLAGTLGAGAVRATADGRRQWLRRGLVVGEVALSLVLLIGAGLMLRSFARLQALDPGFDPDGALTFRVSTRGPEYRDAARRADFYQRVADGLRETPGVVAAGGVQFMPLFPAFGQVPVTADGRDAEPGREERAVYLRATPGFFEAMAMPVLRGRGIEPRDAADAAPVAVVSQSLARLLFGDEDPLGRRVAGGPRGIAREIVGVVGDVRGNDSSARPGAILYVPLAQDAELAAMSFVMRTRSDPLSLLPAAERAVRSVDRAMPVYVPQTLRELLDSLDAPRAALRSLLGAFAGLGLALAVTGIYAALSYNVSRRTRELGIRIALGATRRDVLLEVLGGALLLAAAGIAVGLALSYGLSGVLRGQLYGIEATDPATYAALATLLVLVVLASSAAPALRAASVDPTVALREE